MSVENLLDVVRKYDQQLMSLAEKEFNVTDDLRKSIRTNGVSSLMISVLAIINSSGALPDSLRRSIDEFVDKAPKIAGGFRDKAISHCVSKKEASEVFAHLAVTGMIIEPALASTTFLDSSVIASALYNVRVEREISAILKRQNDPMGMAGGIAVLLGTTCFGEENAKAVFMSLTTLSTEVVVDTLNAINSSSIKLAKGGTGCLFAAFALLIGFALLTYSITLWA